VKPQESLEGNRRKTIGKPNSNPNSTNFAVRKKEGGDEKRVMMEEKNDSVYQVFVRC
jgi:hypothetical protein